MCIPVFDASVFPVDEINLTRMSSIVASQGMPLPLAIVTGAARGIGHAMAENLAAQGKWLVVLVCRDEASGAAARDAIVQKTRSGEANVTYRACDLSDAVEIQALQASLCGGDGGPPVEILVNCACETPEQQKRVTRAGKSMDRQFATNVLGYVP